MVVVNWVDIMIDDFVIILVIAIFFFVVCVVLLMLVITLIILIAIAIDVVMHNFMVHHLVHWFKVGMHDFMVCHFWLMVYRFMKVGWMVVMLNDFLMVVVLLLIVTFFFIESVPLRMPVHILIIVIAVLEVMHDVLVNYLVVHYLWVMIYTFMQMSRVMVVVNNFVSMLSVTFLILFIIMLVVTFFLVGGMVLGMLMLMFMFILFVLIALIKVMYYLVVHHFCVLGSVQLVVV